MRAGGSLRLPLVCGSLEGLPLVCGSREGLEGESADALAWLAGVYEGTDAPHLFSEIRRRGALPYLSERRQRLLYLSEIQQRLPYLSEIRRRLPYLSDIRRRGILYCLGSEEDTGAVFSSREKGPEPTAEWWRLRPDSERCVWSSMSCS